MADNKFDDFKKNPGYNIKKIREARGLTQEDMDDKLEFGIDIKQYQAIEQGRANITLKTFYRICGKLDAHPADIFKKLPFP